MADTVEQNKAYFNKLASEYDSRHGKTIEQLIEHVREHKDFIGAPWIPEEDGESKGSLRLLDYACGTGMVSRALGLWATQCVGVDLSEEMVKIFNARADMQGLSNSEMYAYQSNFCDPSNPDPEAFAGPEFHNFDLAAVGLGFHHFEDPAYAAKQLARRLKPGGVLMIVDFLPHAHTHGLNNEAAHTITAHGFSEEQMRSIFEGAGCGGGFGMREMGTGVVFENMGPEKKTMKRAVFIARGSKV